MNPKALVPLVLGLAIAGFAAKLGFDHLQKARGNTETVTLWTVQTDVPRGATITEQELSPLPYPAAALPPGALTKKEQIVGRVPHTGVPANVPVLNSMLLPPGAQPGIHVPAGFRAVAVKVDESSGVDNHLQPGRYVDVIGLFSVRKGSHNETIAKTIIEKVEVAAVGARLAPDTPQDNQVGSQNGKSRPAKPARAVTLLVKPEQVPKLHLAEQRGKIKLSMRGAEDSPGGKVADAAITEDELLGIDEPKKEEPPAKQADSAFGNSLAQWFQSMTSKPEAKQPIEDAPQVAVAPPKPSYVWKMTVYNGDERQDLGWLSGHPREPVLLGSGGPNVFEQNGRGGAGRMPHRKTPPMTNPPSQVPIQTNQVNQPIQTNQPNQPNQPPVSNTDPNKPQSQSEPKELFE